MGKRFNLSNTSMMIYPVVESLVYITKAMTLEPDVVMMGTPSGVGHARKPAFMDEGW